MPERPLLALPVEVEQVTLIAVRQPRVGNGSSPEGEVDVVVDERLVELWGEEPAVEGQDAHDGERGEGVPRARYALAALAIVGL